MARNKSIVFPAGAIIRREDVICYSEAVARKKGCLSNRDEKGVLGHLCAVPGSQQEWRN